VKCEGYYAAEKSENSIHAVCFPPAGIDHFSSSTAPRSTHTKYFSWPRPISAIAPAASEPGFHVITLGQLLCAMWAGYCPVILSDESIAGNTRSTGEVKSIDVVCVYSR